MVLTTEMFTQFIEENNLTDITTADLPDETLLKIFLSKPLKEELVLNLAEIIQVIHQPICVRSSSLLEDSHYRRLPGCTRPACSPTRAVMRYGLRTV